MQVDTNGIDAICNVVEELCGVYLDDSKTYLIESRLAKLLEEYELAGYDELAYKASAVTNKELRRDVINAITTNETLFFRDDSPYQALQHKLLPEIIDSKAGTPYAKRLRLWSAACSTGQEPYSLAMTLCEMIPDIHLWDVSIRATDISDDAINLASRGHYAEFAIERGLPTAMRTKYFEKDDHGWKICDKIRSLVTFNRINLLEPFNSPGTFDVVLCRNVAIYFTPDARDSLFRRLADTLTKGGYLLTGSSESLSAMGERFVPQHHCRAVVYQPNMPVAAKV